MGYRFLHSGVLLTLFLLAFAPRTFAQDNEREKLQAKADSLRIAGDADGREAVLLELSVLDSREFLRLLKTGEAFYERQQLDSTVHYIGAAGELSAVMSLNYGNPKFIAVKDSMTRIAIGILDRVIVDNSELGELYLLRGTFKYGLSKHQAAVRDFNRFNILSPNSEIVYEVRGFAYFQLGMLDSALVDFTLAIESDPTAIHLYNNRGFVYLLQEKYALAGNDLLKVAENSPDERLKAYALNNIAYCQYQLGDYELAMQYNKASLDKAPLNSYAYRNKGLILIATDQQEAACIALQKAIDLGFTAQYGTEVEELLAKHCKK